MDTKEFQKLLHKYRTGQATDEEIASIDEWYLEFGDKIPEGDKSQKKILRNTIHQQILQAIDHSGPDVAAHRILTTNRWFRNYAVVGKIAAALIGVLFVFYLRLHQSQPFHGNNNPKIEVEEMTVTAELGQVKKLTLADSTVLWLNGGTQVRFPKNFHHAAERKIVLEYGEVHFDVKRDTLKPFLVVAPFTMTKVLGTSFTVKAYKELPYEQVSVASGKVEVSRNEGQQVEILQIGDFAKINKDSNEMLLGTTNPEQNNAWKDGLTYLEQASFEELSLVVKNIYGVVLLAGNKMIEQQRYTLMIDRNVPLADVVEAVSAVNNNRIKKEGGQVIIF
ncbi:FecR family protein [Sphingobacterium wenxiniae]|uniref:FecR protein domain-containing protein n=1 Tax=Sphingobacterium wenxiniae TaxID=683125 RepID=A0A1I6PGA7_9SPHI|nr:FecR family protein [Sphingobacterium wenxiniae]SFS39216.1 protein of unknown function [Sphingobacterium wenxiniae]